jgi:hypothetical protein
MSDPVSGVQSAPAAAAAPVVHRKAVPEVQPKVLPKDTVSLSSAAQSALEESSETQAQTTKEATAGDLQAKRLLAKQAAAHAASKA